VKWFDILSLFRLREFVRRGPIWREYSDFRGRPARRTDARTTTGISGWPDRWLREADRASASSSFRHDDAPDCPDSYAEAGRSPITTTSLRQWRSPYAVATKDGAPFAIAGIWENWKEPASDDVRRTPRHARGCRLGRLPARTGVDGYGPLLGILPSAGNGA
jgi:hypothetical protein